jgi:hypothetical protein
MLRAPPLSGRAGQQAVLVTKVEIPDSAEMPAPVRMTMRG